VVRRRRDSGAGNDVAEILVRKSPIELFQAYMQQNAGRDWRPDAQRLGAIVNKTIQEDLARRVCPAGLTSPDGRQRAFDERMNGAIMLFLYMVGDLGWSVRRALDHVYDGLRAALDGREWEPPAGGPDLWVPSGAGLNHG